MSDRGLGQEKSAGRDSARLLLAAGMERFSTAAADLHLSEEERLTEWQRLTASSLLHGLVSSIEDTLRQRIIQSPDSQGAASVLRTARPSLARPLLERAHVLRDAELGRLLVRRVEEHRFWKEHSAASGEDFLTILSRDAVPTIASEALGLLILRSRRLDRFQEPRLDHEDLPASLHHRLTWMTAAALRHCLVQDHAIAAGEADAAISGAATQMVDLYDEAKTPEAAQVRLAQALLDEGRLDGSDLATLLDEGQLSLFIAALSLRCSLDYMSAWEVLADPRGEGSALLLRYGGVERNAAARILLALNAKGRLFSGQDGDAAARQLDIFDDMTSEGAFQVLQLWRVDPAYRSAIARLSTRRSGARAA